MAHVAHVVHHHYSQRSPKPDHKEKMKTIIKIWSIKLIISNGRKFNHFMHTEEHPRNCMFFTTFVRLRIFTHLGVQIQFESSLKKLAWTTLFTLDIHNSYSWQVNWRCHMRAYHAIHLVWSWPNISGLQHISNNNWGDDTFYISM